TFEMVSNRDFASAVRTRGAAVENGPHVAGAVKATRGNSQSAWAPMMKAPGRTVTYAADETLEAPRSSAARAVMKWNEGQPRAGFGRLAVHVYGGAWAVPTTTLSTRKSTEPIVPSGSHASAVRTTAPGRSVAPVSGAVRVTCGRMFGAATRTVTVTGSEV